MKLLRRFAIVLSWIVTALLWILWFANSMKWIPIKIQPFEPALFLMTFVAPFVTSRWWKDNNDTTQQDNRAILMDIVRNNWINAVLEETLKEARFDIKLNTLRNQVGDLRNPDYKVPTLDHEKPTAPSSLINAVLRRRHERKPLTGTAQAIPKIFHDVSEKLLILGAPGSGKSVLLLELAKALLQEAHEEPTKSVPVIFNLSSWAVKRQPLRDWLIAELRRNYGVDGNLAKRWIDGDSLIYLLDGLDEVADSHRNYCLNVINEFLSPARQVAISSRTGEYTALSSKLNVHDAIELLPLDKSLVKSVFEQHLNIETVEAIMESISTEETLWREINNPLFVNILINSYIGGKPFSRMSLEADTKQQVHQLIIEPFLLQQLRNNPDGLISNEDTWRYLSWIAYNLERRNLSQFYVEMIQGNWLNIHNQALRSKFSLYRLVERFEIDLGWQVGISLRRAKFALFHVVKRNAVLLLFLLILSALVWIFAVEVTESFFSFVLAICVSLLFGALLGSLVDYTRVNQRIGMNQGFYDTLKLGLTIGTTAGIAVGMYSGPTMGIIVGTVASLLPGRLGNVIKHVIFRIVLVRNRLAPRDYDSFFETVVNRRIMRRVGGSVFFVHRYIQEYFADEWKRRYQNDFEH